MTWTWLIILSAPQRVGGAATFAVNHALDFVSSGRVGADARDGDPSTRLAMATSGRRFSGSARRGIAHHSTCDGAVPLTGDNDLHFVLIRPKADFTLR